jgi:hypothetical protein
MVRWENRKELRWRSKTGKRRGMRKTMREGKSRMMEMSRTMREGKRMKMREFEKLIEMCS